MKSSFSWEIILVGILIIGVSVYLFGSDSKKTELFDSDEVVHAHPTPETTLNPGERSTRSEYESTSLGNNLSETPEDLGDSEDTSDHPDDADRSGYQPLAAGSAAQPHQQTEDIPSSPEASEETLTATSESSRKTTNESTVSGILGTVLTQVARATDEITGNSDFIRKYGGQDASMVKSRQFPALGLGRIQTDLSVANILMKSHDSDQVVVELWLSDGFDISDFEKEFRLEIDRNQDVLSVRIVKSEQETGFFSRLFGFFERGGKNIQPGVRILVPEGALTYELNSAAGNIEVFNTGGDVILQTRAGNVRIGGLFGHITADTRAGNIRAENISGNMILRTRAGNIDARQIDAHSELRSTAGNIRLTLDNITRDLDLETRVGNIHLDVPLGFSADVSLDASQISVPEAFEVTGDKTDRYIRGEVNGGGSTLRAHTRVGNLTIRTTE